MREAQVEKGVRPRAREGDGILYRAMVNFPEDGEGWVVERTVLEALIEG